MEMVKEFREGLDRLVDSPCGSIYRTLFSLMTDEELKTFLEHHKDALTKSSHNWFNLFQKSLQSQFFDIEGYKTINKLTYDEQVRRSNLQKSESLSKEESKELKFLNSKFRSKEYVSVSGKFDSILRQTIYLDSEDVLKSLMDHVLRSHI